ncbi:hypothetical protein DPMN_157357 [Dreissena polymorpha]|uniref:Uncharacterized protein n=1 Tax=Dreissena polymorpha TaxID=45954 RepID=A0A9D4INR3_DREPO|nr:hypothetical protein DPMN_157357 [Dreissena polymorpha]
MDIDEDLIIDEDEQLAQNTYLFSPMYSRHHNECSLCILQYITEYEEQIRTFEIKLVDINSKLGCGIQTCVTMVLNEFKDDERMSLFTKLTTSEITSHFDSVFGYPMCGYNRLKAVCVGGFIVLVIAAICFIIVLHSIARHNDTVVNS